MEVIIVGGGIAGLASAIALTKWMVNTPNITILELRQKPSTIGGAINLTPNALRALQNLGVLDVIRKRDLGASVDKIELFNAYNGAQLGHIAFAGTEGNGIGEPPFKALRIMRSDLLQALYEFGRSLENIRIEHNAKTTAINEEADKITITMDSGKQATADLLLGCDGIHSVVRSMLIEPERKPEYTGIAATYGFADLDATSLPWQVTGLCQTRQGSMMCSHYESTRSKQYVSAITETADVQSREGWLARSGEQENIKDKLRKTFGNSGITSLGSLVDSTHDWTLYPVYKLGPKGKWCTKRAVLLGDAAHAMPPQGESVGIALEDAITFARVMTVNNDDGLPGRFAAYERIRRPRVDIAYNEATFGWETQKDSGWVAFQLRCWITSVFLWWTAGARLKRYSEDLATVNLDLS